MAGQDLALLAGPACWLALYLIQQQPLIHWGWPLHNPWHYLLPVLFYPVLEEIVFRGLVQELVHEPAEKIIVEKWGEEPNNESFVELLGASRIIRIGR